MVMTLAIDCFYTDQNRNNLETHSKSASRMTVEEEQTNLVFGLNMYRFLGYSPFHDIPP